MTHTTLRNTKAQIFAELLDLRTKYNNLVSDHDQLLHDASVLEMELEDLRAKHNALAAARQGTSRQDYAASRWEIMQKAKALAMSSGRCVKC